MDKFKDKFNIIVLANSSMDVGEIMENLNIKKKQKNKQFVYIKINN